jgi:hypothetical protein
VKSAEEDLRERTLGKITGIWGKLTYLAGRRSADGRYQHWGFQRAHGTESAQDAFLRVHHSLIGTILQTRLRSLRDELAQSSSAAGTSPSSYVSMLRAGLYGLLPAGCPKATELHLISILKTLAILESHSQPGSRSSSRPLQLGRSLPPPADV